MSLSPLAKSAFRIGALVVAVGMLGGYLWMTQRDLATAASSENKPEFDPLVTSKSAVIIDGQPDPTVTATPAFDPSITSKSFQVVKPEALNGPAQPRLSSKVGRVFSETNLLDPKGQPVLKNEEEEKVVESLIGPDVKGPLPGFDKGSPLLRP